MDIAIPSSKKEHRILYYERLYLVTRVRFHLFRSNLLLRVFKYRFQLTSHFSSACESSQIFENEIIMILFGLEMCSHFLRIMQPTRRPNSSKMKETHTLNKLNFIALSGKEVLWKRKRCVRDTSTSKVHVSDGKKTQMYENKKSD